MGVRRVPEGVEPSTVPESQSKASHVLLLSGGFSSSRGAPVPWKIRLGTQKAKGCSVPPDRRPCRHVRVLRRIRGWLAAHIKGTENPSIVNTTW